jgi:hypothetical protein
MSITSILRAQEILKEHIRHLPANYELRMSDFVMTLAKENIVLSAASMTESINVLVEQGLLVRITKQRLAVAVRDTRTDLEFVQEQPLRHRVAALEQQVADLTTKLDSLANRLL